MKTQQEIENYEAKIQLVQIGIHQYNDTVFSAPSFSGGSDHYLTVVDGKVTYCSECKGFKYYGHCCHAIALVRFLEAQKAAQEETSIQAAIAAIESIVEYEQEQEAVAEAVKIVKQIRRPYNTQNRELKRDEKYGILLR